MAAAGADAVIAHMGLTVGGSIGMTSEEAMTLDASCELVQAIGESALAERPETIVLCHGGPIATPDDAAYVMGRSNAVGFVGASSMERLPVEEVEHTVQAAMPSNVEQQLLGIGADEPCLILNRRSWSGGAVLTMARLVFPASRYELHSRHRVSP